VVAAAPQPETPATPKEEKQPEKPVEKPAPPPPQEKPKEQPKPAPAPVVQQAPPPPPPAPAPKPVVAPPPEPVKKLPVPDQAAQARAEKTIRQTYKADFAKKKTEEHLALAAKLLQPGRENRKDPPEWFVLFREARDQAIAGQSPRL